MANSRYDLAIIGSGPGGYVAAIRAAQLKMKVAVVERDRPGGVCLNWGCIPSKALLNSAELMEEIRGAKDHGIQTGEITVDFKRVIARSRDVADKLQKGVRFLFKKNHIDLFEANATIAGPHTLALAQAEGKPAPTVATIEADKLMVAAGSGERLFPGMQIGDGVMTSKEALVHDRIPSSLIVIGAGAIGLEMGYFYQAFGSQVTIIELEKQMLPGFDAEIAEELRRNFIKRKGHSAARPRIQIDAESRRQMVGDRQRRRRREKARSRECPYRGWTRGAQQEPRPRESRRRGRSRLHQG